MTKLAVRYCRPIPRMLRAWCDAHAHQIQEVDAGEGCAFENRSGFAFDVLLRPGWRTSNDHCPLLLEPTVKAMIAQLRAVKRCDCDKCTAASRIEASL